MIRDEILPQLKSAVKEFLDQRGYELIDISCYRQARDTAVSVLADRPGGGISIAECASLNRELGLLLDEKKILAEPYTLEVSSPGLDRPLREKKDFLRNLHKKAHLFLGEPVEGRLEYEGSINRVDDSYVSIVSQGLEFEIPLASIKKGKLIV